jgi:hypothetical protein
MTEITDDRVEAVTAIVAIARPFMGRNVLEGIVRVALEADALWVAEHDRQLFATITSGSNNVRIEHN